jgi:hypothetical protein
MYSDHGSSQGEDETAPLVSSAVQGLCRCLRPALSPYARGQVLRSTGKRSRRVSCFDVRTSVPAVPAHTPRGAEEVTIPSGMKTYGLMTG